MVCAAAPVQSHSSFSFSKRQDGPFQKVAYDVVQGSYKEWVANRGIRRLSLRGAAVATPEWVFSVRALGRDANLVGRRVDTVGAVGADAQSVQHLLEIRVDHRVVRVALDRHGVVALLHPLLLSEHELPEHDDAPVREGQVLGARSTSGPWVSHIPWSCWGTVCMKTLVNGWSLSGGSL